MGFPINEYFLEQLLYKADSTIDDEGIKLLMDDVRPILDNRVMTHISNAITELEMNKFSRLIML
jgi:hypothetical protein